MGKIFIFLLLVMGGIMYLLKDAKLSSLSKSKSELSKESPQEAKRANDGEFAAKWTVGTCLYNKDDQWNFEKITFASDKEYKFIVCRKFKGCTTEAQSYPALAYEKDRVEYLPKPCQ